MKERKAMTLAFQKVLAPATGEPASPGTANDTRLHITVVFTSSEPTIAALKQAGTLATRLNARISLVVPQIVPYPLPLSSPPVLLDFSERHFRAIAHESPVETTVRLYLCRDRLETLLAKLEPKSLVVVGGRKRWWPTHEKRLAKKLRRAGHEVVFTESE